MSELPIDANVQEIGDGPFYPVKLHSVPRVGDLIKLYSFIDANDKNFKGEAMKHYEVVQVVHDLHDVSEKIPQAKHGCHAVIVFVKPSGSAFLK